MKRSILSPYQAPRKLRFKRRFQPRQSWEDRKAGRPEPTGGPDALLVLTLILTLYAVGRWLS